MTNTRYISEAAPLDRRVVDIQTFYQRLATLGFQKSFVREVLLPEWWCDEFEQEKGAVVEAAAYVSRRSKLDFDALLDDRQEPVLRESGSPCYKLRQGTEEDSLTVARAMAEQVAEITAFACTQPFDFPQNTDAQTIRSQILTFSDFVTLDSLLTFCWQIGLPVVHTTRFPKGKDQRKFDGMVGEYGNRPVILISKNRQSPAWLAFILAHELGHIVRGHINGFSIVDEKIEPDQQEDLQELEADQFAIELLFGQKNSSYYCLENLTVQSLIAYAKFCSERDRVSPASVILNYAWFKGKMTLDSRTQGTVWAIANIALKEIENHSIPAAKIINRELETQLNWEALSVDNQEFLARMTEIEVDSVVYC